MEVILTLFICIAFAYLMAYLFSKIKIPKVIAHVIVGFCLGIPAIKEFVFSSSSLNLLEELATLGMIFLLYFVGLKINLKSFRRSSGRAVNIGLLSAIIPFIFGFLAGMYFRIGITESIIIGACLSITAEAISAVILEELNLLNTNLGELIIEAGIVDDIFEVLILTILGTLIQTNNNGFSGVTSLIIMTVVFAVLIILVRYLFVPLTLEILGKKPSHSNLFTASFVIVLLMASVGNYFHMGVIIGAILAGIIVKHTLLKEHKEDEEKEVIDIVETLTFGFLEPIFFIWIGLNIDIGAFMDRPDLIIITVVMAIVASAGKIIGSVIGNTVSGGTVKEGMILGWGMNSRGGVELIAAEIARTSGLINGEIYAVIVFTAFITTLISPIIFKKMVANHHYHHLKDNED